VKKSRVLITTNLWANSHINTHQCAKRNLIKKFFFRLACIKHALSIHSEPGSNSSLFKKIYNIFLFLKTFKNYHKAQDFTPLQGGNT
jgi:hypothetical protein